MTIEQSYGKTITNGIVCLQFSKLYDEGKALSNSIKTLSFIQAVAGHEERHVGTQPNYKTSANEANNLFIELKPNSQYGSTYPTVVGVQE